MLPGNSTNFVYRWTEEEERARVAALARSGRVLTRRAARQRAWDNWGMVALAGGLLLLFLAALLYLSVYGPNLAGLPRLFHAAWRLLSAGVPAACAAAWHWLWGWTRPYVPAGASGLTFPAQSRLAHAIAAHRARLAILAVGMVLSGVYLRTDRAGRAVWVFALTLLIAAIALPFAQSVIGSPHPTRPFSSAVSAGYPGS